MAKHARGTRATLAALLVPVTAALVVSTDPGEAKQASLNAYRGQAAWVDIYDDDGWADPEGTILAMKQFGVRTLFLQTCNYRCVNPVHRPATLSRWVEAAHAQGMNIVAWYLPGFDDMGRDYHRSLAAIEFQSLSGQRFDSFALDIEARQVTPVAKRNRRVLKLSSRIREAVGKSYPLGAITIPWFYDWGGVFPYKGLDRHYDVFVPMIYFSGRTKGAKGARLNTARNIQEIREGTGDPHTRVHAIGGIADELNRREVAAFVNTARRRHAIGVSLYDYFTSGPEDWEKLAAWN